jgi:hypothetical protein
VKTVPVNVNESTAQDDREPVKSLEFSISSPRHGEFLPLRARGLKSADVTGSEPLITEYWAFGGCSENAQPTYVRVPSPGVIEVEFDVLYESAPGCTGFGPWGPKSPCREQFIFELTPMRVCGAGCRATAKFEQVEQDGFSYKKLVPDSAGCVCD